MTFIENTNPSTPFGTTDNDPLAAGLPPLYEDGIADDGLPPSGASDPANGAEFVVIDDPVAISELEGSTEAEDPILGESSETESDSTLQDPISGTSQPENSATELSDPLINPGNEAIENTESATGDEIDDTSAIETQGLSEVEEETDPTSDDDTDEPEVLPETAAENGDSVSEDNSDDLEATAEDADVESDDNSDDAEAVTESTAEETQPETAENDDAEEESLTEDAEVAIEPEATETPTVEDFNFTQIQSGIFTPNSDGIVRIDYLFDDGTFESEVAIFSLEGMEELWSADNPRQFIAEAARRSISNSELGGIAISDATEGARFSDANNRFNSGTYTGVKTLQMRPGDRFAVMVVPNGTVRDLLDKLEMGHSPRTLFSIAEFNRNGDAYFVQATNGNGDGDVFAFEDLRLDGNSDRDFNDIVFQLRGAMGAATPLDEATTKDWRQTDWGQALIEYATMPESSGDGEPVEDSNADELTDKNGESPTENTNSTDESLEDTVTDESEDSPTEETYTPDENPEDAVTDEVTGDSGESSSEDNHSLHEHSEDIHVYDDPAPLIDPDEIAPPERIEFPRENQPLIGIIDTGFAANNPDIDYSNITLGSDLVNGDNNPLQAPGEGNEHGTYILGIIAAQQDNGVGVDGINDDAPIWVGQAIGSGSWATSLVEFVDAAKESGQPNAVVNLSFDLTQIDAEGNVTTRYEFTPEERAAIEYARQNGVLLVVAAGNNADVMSVLGQASQEFDNILTVGSAQEFDLETSDSREVFRTDYSSYGSGLDVMTFGGTTENPEFSLTGDGVGTMSGTSVATAKVTGFASQVWAANPGLNYRQVIDILKNTATDLGAPGYDEETGAGLVNMEKAIQLAQETTPEEHTVLPTLIPETWTGEGLTTPSERAVATQFMGKYYDWKPYTIQRGDTLSGIASRTMGNGSAPYYNFIALKNGIANPNYISAGAQILVPYEVSSPINLNLTVGFDGKSSHQTYINTFNRNGGKTKLGSPINNVHRWANGYTQDLSGGSEGRGAIMKSDRNDSSYWVGGQFWNLFLAAGGATGILDYPTSDRYSTHRSVRQNFQGGAIIQTSKGIFPLYGGIGAHYLKQEGGEKGRLGLPISAEISIGGGKVIQKFENGRIVFGDGPTRTEMNGQQSVTIGGHTIGGKIYPVWNTYKPTIGNPVSGVYTHPSGAQYQLFQNGSIVSSRHGTFPLYGGIRQTYLKTGGLNSWLGAPKSAERSMGNGVVRQDFEGGYIIWNGSTATAYRYGDGSPSKPPISPTPSTSLHLNPTPSNPLRGFVHPLSGQGSVTQGNNGSTSHSGRSAYAYDYGVGIGTPVYAMRGGRVVQIIDGHPDTGGGPENKANANYIVVEHENGYRSAYLHLKQGFSKSTGVYIGKKVSAGQLIGYSGNSGWSTGPHLHAEVHKGNWGNTVPFKIG